MLAEAFLLIRGAGLSNKIRGIRSMGTGVVSAGFVTDKAARKESGTDTKLTHRQTRAHTCPDRNIWICPGRHTWVCALTQSVSYKCLWTLRK